MPFVVVQVYFKEKCCHRRSQSPCSNRAVWSERANLFEQPLLWQTLQLFLHAAQQHSAAPAPVSSQKRVCSTKEGLWEGDERHGLNVTSIWEIGTYNVAGVICFHPFCGLFEFIIHKPSGNYTLWRIGEFGKSLFFFPNSVLFVCCSAPYHC